MTTFATLPNPSPSPNPDLTVLAASLQEAAQALLAVSPMNASIVPQGAPANPSARNNAGETRSFYFPAGAVRLEKDLLQKYRADDFQGLLEKAHMSFSGLAKLMQSVHKDVRVKGHVIASLGAQLDHAAALLIRMRHVYDNVVPVQK